MKLLLLPVALILACLTPPSQSFVEHQKHHQTIPRNVLLLAKRKARNKSSKVATSGFGGTAKASCACGSKQPYDRCCGLLHKDTQAYTSASAEEVVRARYTAFSMRVVDFIVDSTHPEHPSFEDDIAHWKETIRKDCYDNFSLRKCEILSAEEEPSLATVRFLAHMTQRDTGDRTFFVERSTFERHPETGAWLYKNGEIESVDGDTKE